MTIPVPSDDQIRRAAEECGLSLSDEDVASYREMMKPMVHGYNVARLPRPTPEVADKRTPGRFPDAR